MDAAQVGLLKRVMNLVPGAFTAPDRNQSAAACEMNGIMYPHGSEIREGARIVECIDGQWEERIDFFVTVGP